MKNPIKNFRFTNVFTAVFAGLILTLLATSCSDSDEENRVPTATKFQNLKSEALHSLTQTFQFNAETTSASFTSTKGVIINIYGNSLTLNGNPVTGTVALEYIEIFSGGDMLTTGMHTMGMMPSGGKAMLLSGGEFYINATKNGQQLELNGSVTLQIPSSLTDESGGNPEMTLWNFIDENVWVEQDPNANGQMGVFLETLGPGSVYYAFVGDFGWTNVDIFYDDPRPKTTLLASVPEGYDNQNSAVYLHYDGEGNGLATLDMYDTATGLFSEHYGQIPIGLECHLIFVTESNGQWRYAIKPATITAGAIYDFTLAETIVGTQAQLTAAINALP